MQATAILKKLQYVNVNFYVLYATITKLKTKDNQLCHVIPIWLFLAECVMFSKVFFAARHFRVASPPANCSKNLPQPHTLPRQRVLLVVIFSKSESRATMLKLLIIVLLLFLFSFIFIVALFTLLSRAAFTCARHGGQSSKSVKSRHATQAT